MDMTVVEVGITHRTGKRAWGWIQTLGVCARIPQKEALRIMDKYDHVERVSHSPESGVMVQYKVLVNP